MSRTTQRRSSVRPPWGTWGGVCQKSPAFTWCSTPSWIRIHSPSRHTPHCSFGCECTGDTECGSSVTTDSIALTPGKIRAEMPGASCRTMPPSRRLWNIRSPFVSVYSRDLNPYSNSRSQGGSVRFFVAMFSHETNTFSTIPTDRRQFEARDLRYGGELLEAYRGTGTCLGGMIEAAGARGVTLVPSLAAAASPAGRVTADFYEATTRRLLDDLRGAGRLDGVLLDLHGAMVPEGLEDGEGDLLRAVRATVGSAVPVAATLDFHANVTAEMVRHTTLLHGYKTYPHVDMDARGREATERLRDVVAKRRRPTVAWRQPPLIPPIAGQLTARGPMRRLYDRAAEMERDPRVVTISIFAGFPLADIRDAGLSVYVATDGDPGLADRLADELTAIAWAHRREFLHTALPVREAVAHALARTGDRSSSPTSPTTRAAGPPATRPRSSASSCASARARPPSPASGTRTRSRRARGRASGPRSRWTWAARSTRATARPCA